MSALPKSVRVDEISFDVALLHKVLDVFGLTVAKEEVERRRAGADTRDKVRALQGRLNVAADESTVADEATIAAMTEALRQRGLLEAERSFIVSGTVRQPQGAPAGRQRLLAFDVDLRGAGAFRDVKRVAEIAKHGGFEFLGHTESERDGAYGLTFYEWQYRRAERGKADIVVFAIDEDDGVIGRSRLVDSSDYDGTGLVRGLDVALERVDPRTEYEILIGALGGFLKESGVALADIAASGDQIAFTATELDLSRANVALAASAERMMLRGDRRSRHELLYGIGRQHIRLEWTVLSRKSRDELRTAIAASARARIIRELGDEEIGAFLDVLLERAAKHVLGDEPAEGDNRLTSLLSNALPKEAQRLSFVKAVNGFDGSDFREFWNRHLPQQPEFRDNGRLVSDLLLTQQLALLSGGHQPLIAELQVDRKLESVDRLFALEPGDWLEIVRKTGVPEFVTGEDGEERARNYAEQMQGLLDAAFPTHRIARMIDKNQLPIEATRVSAGIARFLGKAKRFDFAGSRVHDFDEDIRAAAGEDFADVKRELLKIQRVFQVSSAPETMAALMRENLHSAHAIADIPRKSFVKTYAKRLGGEASAFAVHQRASHVATRAELAAMRMWEYSQGAVPQSAMAPAEQKLALGVLQNRLPNYSELFGSPDLCECEHCRSVYGAAAYLVDLLRFLWRGEPNGDGRSPLRMLESRRPDLLHLPLTCENSNTILPYVDLANEVMEYYTANDSLTGFEGHDTGEATAAELRANPQNFDLDAYRKIKDAKYPFGLPYHQPLDVIRTYSNRLQVSRYEALKAMNPQPSAATAAAIAAESLRLSEEEYEALTGSAFDGSADATPLHEYFGYGAAGELENMSGVPEFLHRSGVRYTDLVELVETQFLNPYRGTLDSLDRIFSFASIGPSALYAKLEQVKAGTLNPAGDAAITAALAAYGAARETDVTPAQFGEWIAEHFDEFLQVVTLYQPESKCDLETTKLRTIESIYEGSAASGLTEAVWSKIHRFIRLWRKLDWTVHEVDLMLAALGEADIAASTVGKLESVVELAAATRLPPNELAVFWGNIDTYGKKSLYRKLFLNKAVQQIDPAFEADAWGDYLRDGADVLQSHESTILAAFRIREEDLAAIVDVARVNEGGNPRALDLGVDKLTLGNLSTIYRHVALAKALKMRVGDLCKLIDLFGASPFSTWDVDNESFTGVAPEATHSFYELAAATKKTGFKAATLEYVLRGSVPAESALGLDRDKTLRTVTAIRSAFAAIEQSHPNVPPAPLTTETLTAKLALTFQPGIVGRFLAMLDGSASFETITDANLDIVIPAALSGKYTYVKGSGRLGVKGIVSDDERIALKGLANATPALKDAVDELYAAPESLLATHFNGIFADLAEANATLLDHPAQAVAATLERKLEYAYLRFVPALKQKLLRDAVTRHVGALIGLSEAATALLIGDDIAGLVAELSRTGYSATYFNGAAWTAPALRRTDSAVDFAWGPNAPDPAVAADNFSVRWEAYVSAPASGTYTLVVDVAEADEAFKLYVDDALVLEKVANGPGISREVEITLNAARLHRLRLDYAEAGQDAGVRLRWKTPTSGLEVVPSSAAHPAAIVDEFAATAALHHRAAKLITGFGLSEAELNHLLAHGADFGNIDFKALTAEHWKRVNDYVTLRRSAPQALALLTDVFAAAKRPNPAPSLDDLRGLLYAATAWDEANLDYLIGTHFGLTVSDFTNEVALNRLREVMRIVARSGLSARTVAAWGAAETDFDALHATAQLMKRTVKAKYGEAEWLEIAGDLSDKLRERQKQALIGYLLTRPAIRDWGATDADSLLEYFLIDVQMDPCMDTSRIVQAHAAVQMFVNRCLLNLESDMKAGIEKGVSAGAIDKDRWAWMKNYRVWEANRKVFLYPENWLEPEWRRDRSEFFRELESYLVQNDITARSVEQAFRNYLTSLNEVANLDVCGLHRENYDDGNLKYLHVFGRTHNAPYRFYYRRWSQYRKWSAWERVPVDVRSVEDGTASDADNDGVHLVPVVWKNRLFLFWPEFLHIQEAPGGMGNTTAKQAGDSKISTLQANDIIEIRLAWSERVDGKWQPKQVSKEFLRQWPHDVFTAKEKDFLFTPSIDDGNQELTITVSDTYWNVQRGRFVLADIQSPVRVEHYGDSRYTQSSDYGYAFMRRHAWKKLELLDDVYLKESVNHKLLPVVTYRGADIELDDPFFYSDAKRTYFARPVPISIYEWVKNPIYYKPLFPKLAVDPSLIQPVTFPPVDPDEILSPEGGGPIYLGGATMRGGAGRFPTFHVEASGGDRPPMPRSAGAAHLAAPAAVGSRAMRSGGAPAAASGHAVMAKGYGVHQAYIGSAFAEGVAGKYLGAYWRRVRYDTGLEFHTFYHPYSSRYVTRLNQVGLPGLMESDTILPSDDGDTFEDEYDPNFANGFVQKPGDFPKRTYYKENVCFDVYGANSQYNWELFFHAPLYIATRLSRNGKHREAMEWFHYIFDPTTDESPGPGESETSRYWKVPPFKTAPAQSLEDWFSTNLGPNADPNVENAVVAEWRDNPFDPHGVAANRPLAYMKHVVVRYVENLIAWGDSLFRVDTREAVNEALQIYVIANHILGPRPQLVPKRGAIRAETYESLSSRWDDFSNALVELENIFPYSSEAAVSTPSPGTNLLGIGPALYFCIPPNDKLLEHWDTVADRLYKIRHCQNIDGVERKLALFAPPIEPDALIQAAAQGVSLGSILADLSSPPPIYRFSHLIQKATEFCADVKALGSTLLAALEKSDAEELGRVRAAHETQMLELIASIKEREVLDAKLHRENLQKAREAASFRLRHYIELLGNELPTVPAAPTLGASLTADSQLPADTLIPTFKTDVDDGLEDSGERGVKLIPKEKSALDKNEAAKWVTLGAGIADTLAGIFSLIPQVDGEGTPLGVGAGAWWGGQNLGAGTSALARAATTAATFLTQEAAQATVMASYIRREQEWTLQANLAAKDIVQLDKQITSAEIRLQTAENALEHHRQQIDNAKTVELFLKEKFTNDELYQWMKEQLYAVYKQSYDLAYEMAKRTEKAYKYETGRDVAGFIQYGYWDDARQGLVAGERLHLALRQLEQAHLDENRRELELTKHVSLARVNPLALVQLRETGRCHVSIPEELFDLDFRGHYFRRIKAVRLSIPCVAGPYTSVSCSLRLLNNAVRINTSMNGDGGYERENDEGLPIDDDRFRTSRVPVDAIATSQAQSDAGVFEFNFRDDRYLPFEGAGVISEWQIELSTDKALRQFDYTTISDVVLQLNYTARESGGVFRDKATAYIKDFLANSADFGRQPLLQLFDLRHEFPTEWHKFLRPTTVGAEQILDFTLGRDRFPFFAQDRDIVVMKLEVFARCTHAGDYHLVLSYTNGDGDGVESAQVTVPQSGTYGGLNAAALGVNDAGLTLDEIDVDAAMSLKLKRGTAADYTGLATAPRDEVQDAFLVVHYKLGN